MEWNAVQQVIVGLVVESVQKIQNVERVEIVELVVVEFLQLEGHVLEPKEQSGMKIIVLLQVALVLHQWGKC